MKALWRWLGAADIVEPDRADADLSHFIEAAGVRLAGVFALGILVAGLIATVLNVVLDGSVPPGAGVPFTLLGLAVLILLRRGHSHFAILVLLWGMCLVALLSAASLTGLRALGLMVLPIVMMSAGWLVGGRQALWLAITSLGGILGLYWMHAQGVSFVTEMRISLYAVAHVLVIMLGAAIGLSTTRIVRAQYDRVVTLSNDLRALNADLEARVAARTAELSAALEQVRRTQDDLIQAEKLASLGSMVAGISHELNTPVGNAVTVISALLENAQTLDTSAQAGTMKRSELAAGLRSIIDMGILIDRSVNRAATLIASFKQVAVDQTSEQRREFDLRELVENNLAALRPGFKHQPWIIVNAVPAGLRCDSYPGPLGQVLTNLVQNAVLHAFEGRDEGRVDVNGRIDGEALVLDVADDGNGMTTATVTRIFEPFFTTKLGKGGSGLGLSVCRRIVTNILAGDLTVLSTAGSGSCFTVRMPLRTPGKL